MKKIILIGFIIVGVFSQMAVASPSPAAGTLHNTHGHCTLKKRALPQTLGQQSNETERLHLKRLPARFNNQRGEMT